MNNLFLMMLAKASEGDKTGWSFSTFLKNIVDFFTRSNEDPWYEPILRFTFLGLVLSMVIMFFLSGRFLKIVKDEMDKGGEEYGEIASTKVANKAYLYRVLAMVFLVFIVVGLFIALALI